MFAEQIWPICSTRLTIFDILLCFVTFLIIRSRTVGSDCLAHGSSRTVRPRESGLPSCLGTYKHKKQLPPINTYLWPSMLTSENCSLSLQLGWKHLWVGRWKHRLKQWLAVIVFTHQPNDQSINQSIIFNPSINHNQSIMHDHWSINLGTPSVEFL